MARAPKSAASDANGQQDDVAELRRQLAEMTAEANTAKAQLRSEAERRRSAELQNMSAQERALVSEQEACDSRIEAMESEAQSYEDQIAQLADEPGHGKEIAALNRKLAAVSAKLETETNRKSFLAGQREKMKAQPKPEDGADGGNGRVLANGSKLSQYGAKTQAWLEAHPKAFTDARYLNKAILAAQEATAIEGIADQSPEYFAFIEEKLGERQVQQPQSDDTDETDEGDELPVPAAAEHRTIDHQSYEPEKPQQRAAGPGSMAAVPTRNVPQGGNGGGNRRTPTLNAEEREVADALYAHLPAAERYVRYAQGKSYMKQRNSGHFVSN